MTILRKKPDTRTTEERQNDFLTSLEKYGNISKSAKEAKIERKTVYRWKADSKEFLKNFNESAAIGIDALEDEARRRAFEGVLEPVYQKGAKVGTIRKYSDNLLIFLLNGGKPEKYKHRVQHGGDSENPIKHEVKTIKVGYGSKNDFED